MDILKLTDKFYKNFKGEKGIIGCSVNRAPLYCFKVQKSDYPTIIMVYSIHAREYITTYLALKQIRDFEKHGKKGRVFFVPLLNPDGVKISLTQFPLYKANARGVDLNVNFDAKWGKGEKNITYPSHENYIGEYPFSEPESRAIRDFTLKIQPTATVSYHSKGEEIYWYFSQTQNQKRRDYTIAKKLSYQLDYPLKLTPNSCGGYKDWCISTLKIPSFTIEVGNDKYSHPLTKRRLGEIYKQNKGVLPLLTEIL